MSLINKRYQAHLITPNTITVVFDSGPPANILRTNSLFDRVAELLRAGAFGEVPSLVDRALQITTHSKGKFNVRNGVVVIDGEELPHLLSSKLLELVDSGQDTVFLENFWDNLKDNPSKESVADLYEFLEHNKVPIARDGCFVVYKRVASDFKDLRTHSIDNRPGTVVSIPRENVDANRQNTCSHGLHVAAWDYAKNSYYSGTGVLLECKVNPADVVAVPPDYNQQKMRVCRYEVVRVVDEPQTSLTYQEPEDYWGSEEFDDEEDLWNDEDEEIVVPKKVEKKPVPKALPASKLVEKFKPFEVSVDSNGRLRIPGRAIRKLGVGVNGLVTAYIPRGGKSVKLVESTDLITNAREQREYSVRDDNSVRLSPDLLSLVPNSSDAEFWRVSLQQGELRLSPL